VSSRERAVSGTFQKASFKSKHEKKLSPLRAAKFSCTVGSVYASGSMTLFKAL
jgi:hypothetical protein